MALCELEPLGERRQKSTGRGKRFTVGFASGLMTEPGSESTMNFRRWPTKKESWTGWYITSMAPQFEFTSMELAPKKSGEKAIAKSRGGVTCKVHIRIDGYGNLMHVEITAGQVHESTVFTRLMNGEAVQRPWGRPKLRPSVIVGD